MKEIKAYVRESLVSRVVDALARDGCFDFSVVEVRGIARGLPPESYSFSVGLGEPYQRMSKIEVICKDDQTEHLIELIRKAGGSGRPGDGAIFISTVDEAIRIRDGKRGQDILPDHQPKH